jgi:peptidoglycan hydrolase CwlO-like protein
MREPISRDSASPRELVEATKRLDRALQQLEAACAAKVSTVMDLPDGQAPNDDAYAALESDRARLAAELDAARVREGELASAAAAASKALGRAAAEVRAALGEDEAMSMSGGDASDGEGLNEEAA